MIYEFYLYEYVNRWLYHSDCYYLITSIVIDVSASSIMIKVIKAEKRDSRRTYTMDNVIIMIHKL